MLTTAGITSFLFNRFDVDSVAVPLSPTVVYARDCRVIELDIINTTGSGITVTVGNNNGDPAFIEFQISGSTAQGKSLMSYRSQVGKKLTGGMIWSASAPGLVGSVCLLKLL
jgi:hypothetical protein